LPLLARQLLIAKIMTQLTPQDAPPADFVAFLAQRGGLSPEAAETRLERWLGEYYAAAETEAVDARCALTYSS